MKKYNYQTVGDTQRKRRNAMTKRCGRRMVWMDIWMKGNERNNRRKY